MISKMSAPTITALIPARSGSKRVPGKNIRPLGGHPLVAYSIRAAIDSGVFSRVIVSTECPDTAAVARHYGAEVPFLRPAEFAGDKSPDIDWIRYTLERLAREGEPATAFSILRPTSPFRLPDTIRRAWALFTSLPADSLRAVEPCAQHPGKMWVLDGPLMNPLMDDGGSSPPWHSSPYQSLPKVYVQNASLEMAWNRVPLEMGSIAGKRVIPFITEGDEGFDINQPDDWRLAEIKVAAGEARLPAIACTPFKATA
jgi:N-acylneuraminate cytidylyltransferase